VRDPLERLRLIADEMREQKAGGRVQVFDVALAVAGALPAPVTFWLTRLNDQWPIVHTVCTNVPGPSEPRSLAGQRVLEIHPVVPLAMGIGLGFAMLSYAGRFSIAATADPALFRLSTACRQRWWPRPTSSRAVSAWVCRGPPPRGR